MRNDGFEGFRKAWKDTQIDEANTERYAQVQYKGKSLIFFLFSHSLF